MRVYFDEWDHSRNRPKEPSDVEVIHLSAGAMAELRTAFSPPPLDGVDAAAMAMGWNAPLATLTDLRAALDAISFCGALALMRPVLLVDEVRSTSGIAMAGVIVSVPDRDGMLGTIHVAQPIPLSLPILGGELLRIVSAELGRLLLHEVAEGIVVAGIRPFDPHR